MAQKYLKEALEMAPNDPFVLHELGVIAFQSHRYGTVNRVKKIIKTINKLSSQNYLKHRFSKGCLYVLGVVVQLTYKRDCYLFVALAHI